MKGIILAGGSGTRLHPITRATPKALAPVYDKPLIYYSLAIPMLAGIRDVLVITTPEEQPLFSRLLGDGHDLGINITYETQESPTGGIAEALLIAADYLAGDPVCLVLADNLFYGHGLQDLLNEAAALTEGAVLFGYPVADPTPYGVAEVADDGRVVSIEEKPTHPKSNLVITGLYFYDGDAVDIARTIRPSARGQLEITDVNNVYVARGTARLLSMGRGMAWLDAGTHDSLLEASTFVQVIEHRQGDQIACLEEIAWRMGYIDADQLEQLAAGLGHSTYGEYVMRIAAEARR
jgi:glucose-1-phosphate thymidylyltransferase